MTTLVSMIVAGSARRVACASGLVSRLSRRAIQIGMGIALMCAALLFLAKNLDWVPGGGDALGLHGFDLILAIAVNLLLGALMMLGIGLFAPCLIW